MSTTSAPIPLHRFAEAIADLPVENLYMKAAEIRNSLAHLASSNEQLRPFAEDGDRECAQAILENGETIQRMQQRLDLLQQEVTNRGSTWHLDESDEPAAAAATTRNGGGDSEAVNASTVGISQRRSEGSGLRTARPGGVPTSASSTRAQESRTGEVDGGVEDEPNGVHL